MSNMSKSKLPQLSPALRSESNSQTLMLDIMMKMVNQQKQTNKLIKELLYVQKKESSSERQSHNLLASEESLGKVRVKKNSVNLQKIVEKKFNHQEPPINWEARDQQIEKTLERIEKQVREGQKLALRRLENIDKSCAQTVALLQGNRGKLEKKQSFNYNPIDLKSSAQISEDTRNIMGEFDKQKIMAKQMGYLAQKSKNYSILKEILPFSDKREIKAKISIKQIISNPTPATHPNIDNQTSQWLGVVYQVTASICSNMLFNNLLTFEQTKILFTENITYNYIEFMKEIHQQGYDKERFHLTNLINIKSGYILNFLCKKYPQTKIEAPNIALKSLITHISNEGRVKYDLLAMSGGIRKSLMVRDYASQIMQKINYMIDRTNEEYDIFENFMKNIFEEVYLTPTNREKKVKQNIDILTLANKSTYLSAEDQKYKEKVMHYTKYLIGRKIPKNTEKYTEEEIQDGVFFVKTPGILRILVKWVEQLSEYVLKPEQKLKNSYSQFKDHDGNPLYLYSPVKNGVYNLIIAQRETLLDKLQQIKQECYQMEALLTQQIYVSNEGQKHLSQEQTSVGKYCNNLKSAISSILCSQLNQIIQFLLTIPLEVDVSKIGISAQYMQNQARKDLQSLNLVSLRLFDLLRCKCTSNEEEMVWIMKRLLDLGHQKKNFKIIRMKDRLNLGTRDILINAQINNGMVCEIQLSVTNSSDKKQEMFDKYNHFLYELKRSILGPVTENVSIWTTLEQRSQYFEEQIKRNKSRTYRKFVHQCGSAKIRNFVRPIICKICKNFYAIPQTSLRNIKCSTCDSTFCGECYYESLDEMAKKEYIFQKLLKQDELKDLEEYKDESKPFPVSGFFVKKNFLKKQLAYFISILKNKNDPKVDNAELMLLQSVIRNQKPLNRQINKKQIRVRIVNKQFYLNKKMKDTELKNLMIFYFKPKTYEKIFRTIEQLQVQIQKPENKDYNILNILRQPSYISSLSRIFKQTILIKDLQSLKKSIQTNQQLVVYKLKHTFIFSQPFNKGDVLRTSIIAKNNLYHLKELAKQECEIVSMESRSVTTEMDQIQMTMGPSLFSMFVANLRKLYLNNGQISSIQCLSKLQNLSILYIAHNQLTTLQGIETLTSLVLIRFDDNKVISMSPLKNLLELKSVLGNENKLTNCKGLQNLKNLKKLSIYQNFITETKQLANLSSLEQMFIKDNPFDSLSNVVNLTNLIDLSAGYTKINAIPSLNALKKLKSLALDGIGLQKIPASFNNLRLQELWLSHNRIKKIENLEEQSELKHLSLKANEIEKIQNLQKLDKIQLFNLKSNRIKTLNGVQKIMDTLKLLNIRKNPLQDLTGLVDRQFSTRFTLTPSQLQGPAIKQFQKLLQGKTEKSALFFQ